MVVTMNNVGIQVKKYEHVGPLRVQTTRGEVECHRNDYVVTWPDGSTCVLPATAIEPFIRDEMLKVRGTKILTEEERRRLNALTATTGDSFNHNPVPSPDRAYLAVEGALKTAKEKLDRATEKHGITESQQDKDAMDQAAKEVDEAQKAFDVEAKRSGLTPDVIESERLAESGLSDEDRAKGREEARIAKDPEAERLRNDKERDFREAMEKNRTASGVQEPAKHMGASPQDGQVETVIHEPLTGFTALNSDEARREAEMRIMRGEKVTQEQKNVKGQETANVKQGGPLTSATAGSNDEPKTRVKSDEDLSQFDGK